ncbi:CYTH domain-containing protein [Janthinobacterium tructae]|jgi:adenylate cyclase|uniref:CYTH domain-containing protein n=1 Tax=Janthinobacterium tructae TaxID=2590869 RepID=UPI002499DD44|nr:CYTH domain-containing protein [Janthinobacterium tructae]MDI3293049.1 CYTH domain-containing protein [Janthinobacterium tructae]
MGVEIERKFLLAGDAWRGLGQAVLLRQGYLSSARERVVRVRIEGEQAMLTIKGANVGTTRGEWEYPIPLADAVELLDGLCEQPLIEKVRHRIEHAGMVWEVDEFLGANAGLIVAEIELASEDQPFEKPEWIGAEVSGDARYYNANLIRHPFSQW